MKQLILADPTTGLALPFRKKYQPNFIFDKIISKLEKKIKNCFKTAIHV
jgi:hypothetical protein